MAEASSAVSTWSVNCGGVSTTTKSNMPRGQPEDVGHEALRDPLRLGRAGRREQRVQAGPVAG